MAAAAAVQTLTSSSRRVPCWTGTPEVYFSKGIDNSRLVKVEDPRRHREMKQFGIALCCLFLLVMTYAFQHFKAIEYGYKIETLKSQRNSLAELNRDLRLEEASLQDPQRIDVLARKMGLQSPQAGQVIRMDTPLPDSASPILASVTPISVISAR
ncbi:MAG: cell division protein FtsL [Terriglobales bacterium]|jgi:cell division protein FtsL|nr:cell division protein FtsL [Terriglobales bacterium]